MGVVSHVERGVVLRLAEEIEAEAATVPLAGASVYNVLMFAARRARAAAGANAEPPSMGVDARTAYMRSWDSNHGKLAPSASNPLVWVGGFERVSEPGATIAAAEAGGGR